MNGTTVDPMMNKFKKIPQVNPSQDTIKISFVSGYLFVSVAISPSLPQWLDQIRKERSQRNRGVIISVCSHEKNEVLDFNPNCFFLAVGARQLGPDLGDLERGDHW
jgi:hypothetical protein